MLFLIIRFVFKQRMRSALLALGLVAVCAGITLVAVASQTTAIAVDQDLSRYWRTTYDILVRPTDIRSPIEEKYDLIEANHLSGISGGISLAQYDTIKAVPGVEVAAAIAMIAYVSKDVATDSLGQLSDPGVYVLKEILTINDGGHFYHRSRQTFYYVGSDAPSGESTGQNHPLLRPPNIPVYGSFEMPILVAGIDPSQEAALIKLDRALENGEYLTGNEPLNPAPYGPDTDYRGNPVTVLDIPILINATPYISLTFRAELKRLILPPEASNWEAIIAQGGNAYLGSLPEEGIDFQEMEGETAYRRLVEGLQEVVSLHSSAVSMPSRITYQEFIPPFPYNGLVLEISPTGHAPRQFGWGGEEWPAYRLSQTADFRNWFMTTSKGVFDIERLPKPADVNRVPLETYFPPLATLRYDEDGNPVGSRTMRPTLNPAGYVQPPPLILTTLAAAQAVRGDDCISAVRVRVGGIDKLTLAAQRKIEIVAAEIYRRTGLTVDVMVGSSPRRVLVHVPGVDYVEEGWIQKGVNVSYSQRVQSGYFLLLAALAGIGALYVLDLSWAEVLGRRRIIGLQKALGWRSRTVFRQVLGLALFVDVIAAAVGTLLTWGVVVALGWQLPPAAWLVGVPLLTVALGLLGSLYPARLAARLPSIQAVQRVGVRYTRRPSRPLVGQWQYVWLGLFRRWSRTAISGLVVVLSSALLVLLLAVTLEQRGYLAGTLLGEFILLRVEAYHYALLVIGFALAALSTGSNLLSGVLERRREIGVLKAVGWRTRTVAWLFLAEGLLLGSIGGAVGAVAGSALFWGLYRVLSPGLVGAALLGVALPGLVGLLAALYPARVAARVGPAEVMRHG